MAYKTKRTTALILCFGCISLTNIQQIEAGALNKPNLQPCTVIQTVEADNVLPIVDVAMQEDIEKEMLAWTVQQEVGGLSETAAKMTIDCIYNRVDSERFPNTLTEVLTVDQFNGVTNYYSRKNVPNAITKECVNSVDEYRGISNGAVYFCSYNDLTGNAKAWFDSLVFVTEVDGIRFYK